MRRVLPTLLASLVLAATTVTTGAVAVAQDDEPQRGGRLELVALNDPRALDNIQAAPGKGNACVGDPESRTDGAG